jgi:hypothetical protein
MAATGAALRFSFSQIVRIRLIAFSRLIVGTAGPRDLRVEPLPAAEGVSVVMPHRYAKSDMASTPKQKSMSNFISFFQNWLLTAEGPPFNMPLWKEKSRGSSKLPRLNLGA